MSRSRRLSPVLALLLVPPLAAAPARAASPAGSVSTGVVVTAEARPAEIDGLAVAATVIGPEEIERSRASNVLDLLRSVPGVDVVQSGGPEGVASIFLRGANSNQALVFVDGVKLNSPYYGGVDLGSLATSNVERIEVVRGPYSALYGSEAIGGVVQLFTKRGEGVPVRVSGRLAGGDGGTKDGAAAVTLSRGPVEFAGTVRRFETNGDLPNQFLAATNLSAALDFALAQDFKIGFTARKDSSRSGIPFSGDVPTPFRSTTFDATTFALPVTASLGPRTTLEAQVSYGIDRPTYLDPEDPWGFTGSRTDAKRWAGRTALSYASASNRISVGADVERTSVRNEDSYGLQLDDVSQRNWSVFGEDRAEFFDRRLAVTVGARYDRNSEFGGAFSPRAAVSFALSPAFRLRAAGGGAFRAPTAGELYYPFAGNSALSPERSTSFEGGIDWTLGRGLVLEATAFTTDVRDLIFYDFASMENQNVGRARMRGGEVVLRGDLGKGVFARASYTYVDATDRDTGLPLLRRPRNRASATMGQTMKDGTSATFTAVYVGPRDDVDAVTYRRVTDLSYVRVDVSMSGPRMFGGAVIFIRVTNLLGREYAEVAGYPSPGRRWVGGLDLSF